jgi:predicted AlkP superfamily pyrophosphatase or phosphodiesterase
MSNDVIICFTIDAGRWDYISENDTPFMLELANRGIHAKRCISSPGFTQRTAMFSGAYPDATRSFTMYCHNPATSPFRVLKKWRALLNIGEIMLRSPLVPNEPSRIGKLRIKLYKEFRLRIVDAIVRRVSPNAPTLTLPLDVLPFLAMSEENDRLIFEKNSMTVESIFDVFIDEQIPFGYYAYPVMDGYTSMVSREALKIIKGKRPFFTFQFSEPDNEVHYVGAESSKRREIMRKIDIAVEKIYNEATSLYDRAVLLLVGDHGMIDIHTRIDAGKIIHSLAQKSGLKHLRDYLLFLDSTMARLWCLRENTRGLLAEILNHSSFRDHGTIVDEELARKYRFPFPDRLYGDIGWWANPGILISPCYFHPKGDPVMAMHGYESYHPCSQGFIILFDSSNDYRKYIPEAKLVDVCPTICDLCHLRYPKNNEGKSLFSYG